MSVPVIATLMIGTAALLIASSVVGQPARTTAKERLVNGGFEENRGVGTIPDGWQVFDGHPEYLSAGWIAPRVERVIGTIGSRSGRYMIGLDTEKLGVETQDSEFHIPRAAIYQTITVPAGAHGTFSLYYNDIGTTALGHLSAIRLAYTVGHTDIARIRFSALPVREHVEHRPQLELWSSPFFRVSQQLPLSQTAVGDWSYASLPVAVPPGDRPVSLTLWIGIFDHQKSIERGYWRIDDASFTLGAPEGK